ncbi:MAG: CbtA family protein [Phyllobacterium sp.]
MLIKYLLATLVAGLLAGILLTPVMYMRVVPLILHAETFEGEGGHEHPEPAGETAAAPHSHETATEDAAGPELPFGRFGNTLLMNLLVGAGFALVTGAAALFMGRRITVQNGLYWGAAGFFIFVLAPQFGLAPELPAMPAADLAERQSWWIATVLLAAIAVYLIVLREEMWAKILGVVLIAAPHLYGAPQPDDLTSAVPAVLASEYAVASLVTNMFFWAVLGLALGWCIQKFAASELEG